ncbi:7838_t:CDS:2 [Ambispora leptoticha]|uniref:ATPase inhibitor, mitochondrial n=1 Tax=Ambispora leptoticha TaxID=144679 RepID=A0A9N8VBP9_9GLOM|nr:7838_t:CDS:2 [Ambispora leptoticha]
MQPLLTSVRLSHLVSNSVNKSSALIRTRSLVNSFNHLPLLTSATTRLMSSGGRNEGVIREADTAFSKKEKAIEDQYFRAHDIEKIKILQDELRKQKEKLAELENKVDGLASKK